MSRRLLVVLGSLVLASLASAQGSNAKSAKVGALAGTITDSVGTPVPSASVLVLGHDLVAVTDDSGRFHLAGVPAGEAAFTVVKLGFKPVTFETKVLADTTLVVSVRLRSTPRDTTSGREGGPAAESLEARHESAIHEACSAACTVLAMLPDGRWRGLLGGDITAESEVGRGSSFTLLLPAAR